MAIRKTKTATAQQDDTSWKATAFLNLYVGRADGSRRKIGAIALKDSRNFDAALIRRMQEDGAVQALLEVLEIDFHMADAEVTEASLGF